MQEIVAVVHDQIRFLHLTVVVGLLLVGERKFLCFDLRAVDLGDGAGKALLVGDKEDIVADGEQNARDEHDRDEHREALEGVAPEKLFDRHCFALLVLTEPKGRGLMTRSSRNTTKFIKKIAKETTSMPTAFLSPAVKSPSAMK